MATNSIQWSQQVQIYDPLPDGAYTRVLILEPGRHWQPLRCQLKIVNLEEDPVFEAISYVWGSDIKSEEVVCNGFRVKITENLLQALLAVRDPSRPRTVWADSISINQSDHGEKSRQVALMGPIYNRARTVLIHLAGDDRGHAHGVATFVSETLAMIRQMAEDTLAAFPDPSAEEIQLVMEDPRFQSVRYLLDHPWFKRGWVIQEAVLARDAVVIWGAHMIARLDSFMICHSWLVGIFGDPNNPEHNLKPLNVLPDLYRYRFRDVAHRLGYNLGTQPSLLRILDLARQAELKDPRDRVYAFLYLDGLDDRLDVAVDATSRLIIQPDYSKSVAEVYTNFARHCAKSGEIKWLHYVQHTEKSFVEWGFASWVPRWDVRKHISLARRPSDHPTMYPSHHTSDSGSQQIVRFDGNCLIVQGVVFDRVRACHCSSASRNITLSDVVSCWRTVRTSKLGSAYPPEHLGMALLYTLTQGCFEGSWPEWVQEREMFSKFLRATEEDPDAAGSFEARIPHAKNIIAGASTGRKLVSTDKGYFALAPGITEENDRCCIVFGCCFPFILREIECLSGSEPQSYRVVGDAWVAGKYVLPHPEGGLSMSPFGWDYSMEWETGGFKQGDIRLI